MLCECGHDKAAHINPGTACRFSTMKHSPCVCKKFAACECATCVLSYRLWPIMSGAANG